MWFLTFCATQVLLLTYWDDARLERLRCATAVDARTASSSRQAQRRGRAGGAWPPCRPIVAHLPAVVYTLLCARDATQPSSCQHTHIMSLSTINVHKQLLQQLLMIFGCQTMHNFVYFAQRRSQKFAYKPNFWGGHGPPPLPLGCASGLQWNLICNLFL